MAGVAFGDDFWSMQPDCRRGLFGLFFNLAAFRFPKRIAIPKERE
jgi:hypothetical protein